MPWSRYSSGSLMSSADARRAGGGSAHTAVEAARPAHAGRTRARTMRRGDRPGMRWRQAFPVPPLRDHLFTRHVWRCASPVRERRRSGCERKSPHRAACTRAYDDSKLRAPMAPPTRRYLFGALACAFVAASIFHLLAAFGMLSVSASTRPRHGVFAAIDFLCAVGLATRPPPFVWAFAALTAQQLYSHGLDAWREQRVNQGIDWASLVVLVGMPATLVFLAWERRSRGR